MSLLLTGAGRSAPGLLNSALMAARQVLWPQLPSATDEPWAWSGGSGNIFGGYLTALSAVGKYTEWEAAIPPGNCTARILCYKSPNRGIYSLKLDGVEVAQVDLYAASGVQNALVEVSFSVAGSGVTTVRWECVGKNASSTHYVDALQQIELVSGIGHAATDALLPNVVDVPTMLPGSVSTGSLAGLINTAYQWGGLFTANQASPGWEVEYLAWLPAGTHDLQVVHNTYNTRGIVGFYLDGILVGSVDFYSAGNLANVLSTISGIEVGSTGLHTLKLTSTSKNVASTAHYAYWQWLQFVRTAPAGLPATRGRETVELYPWLADGASAAQTWASISSNIFYGYMHAGGVAGNWIEFSVDLAAGSWSLEILHRKLGNAGICHLLLDSADVGQADLYAAISTDNQRSTIAFTVATSGLHTLRLAADSKHASSTGYYLALQLLRLTRTGD